MRTLFSLLAITAFSVISAHAQDAAALARKMLDKESGSSYVRVKMETGGTVLQIQIKSRNTGQTSDVVYQVLFPKERKGESVLLHREGNTVTATNFTPAGGAKPAQPGDSLLGTALRNSDAIESPYLWPTQTITGTETINKIECQILESKSSSGNTVRTWIDPNRLVPLRVEKKDRKIEITRILKEGDESLPIDLTVTAPDGTVTLISGSKINKSPKFAPNAFTPEGLADLTPPQ